MKPTTFALIAGSFVGVTGIMGMIAPLRKRTLQRRENLNFKAGYGTIGGIVPTNDLFNWTRVAIGVAGLAASQNEKASVIYNRSLAGSYAIMAVLGVIPKTDTLFGLMPIFGGNVFLHGGTAVAELLTETNVTGKARELISNFASGPQAQDLLM